MILQKLSDFKLDIHQDNQGYDVAYPLALENALEKK